MKGIISIILFTLVLNLCVVVKSDDSEFLQVKKFLEKEAMAFLEGGEDTETLYKITDGKCGEINLSSRIAYFAKKFGGVVDGNCKDQGYSVFDHTETMSVGPFGSFEIKIYTK